MYCLQNVQNLQSKGYIWTIDQAVCMFPNLFWKKKNKKILVLFPFNMGKRVSFHGKFNENIIYFSHILYKNLQQFCCNNLSIFCLF